MRIFDSKNKCRLLKVLNTEEEVSLVGFSFNEKFIYFVSGKNTLSIFDLQENEEIIKQKFEGSEIKSVCFLPNVNNKLLVGFQKHELQDSTLKLVIISKDLGGKYALLKKDIQFLIAGKLNIFDNTIEIIQEIANDNENLYFIQRSHLHGFQPYVFKAVDFSVQAINSEYCLSSFQNNKDKFTSFVFQNDKRIITGSENSNIYLWSPNHSLKSIGDDSKPISCFCCLKLLNEDYCLSGSCGNEISVWKIKNNGLKLVKKVPGHKSTITSIEFSKDYKYILTSSLDRTIIKWKVYSKLNDIIFKMINIISSGETLVEGF